MSFARPRQPTRRAAVPLAPMLDVLFLLLIFFVTTSSFRAQEQQIDVQLPSAEAAETAEPTSTEVVVNVKADGSIMVGAEAYQPPALRSMLSQLVAEFPDERVIIRGDKNVKYERIVDVMDTARAAGVRNIYFATVKSSEEVAGR